MWSRDVELYRAYLEDDAVPTIEHRSNPNNRSGLLLLNGEDGLVTGVFIAD